MVHDPTQATRPALAPGTAAPRRVNAGRPKDPTWYAGILHKRSPWDKVSHQIDFLSHEFIRLRGPWDSVSHQREILSDSFDCEARGKACVTREKFSLRLI
jgi:hypothetical protein